MFHLSVQTGSLSEQTGWLRNSDHDVCSCHWLHLAELLDLVTCVACGIFFAAMNSKLVLDDVLPVILSCSCLGGEGGRAGCLRMMPRILRMRVHGDIIPHYFVLVLFLIHISVHNCRLSAEQATETSVLGEGIIGSNM